MLYAICKVLFVFLLYSFVGYVTEILACLIDDKYLTFQRGYLLGPWIPIFGCGFLLLFPLTRYEAHPEVVFIMGAFLSTVLEYATSLIMEKIFRTRWWDYSHDRFNINVVIASNDSEILYKYTKRVIMLKDNTAFLEGDTKEVYLDVDKLDKNGFDIPEIVRFVNIAKKKKNVKKKKKRKKKRKQVKIQKKLKK